mgnify:CR=1 FL=1
MFSFFKKNKKEESIPTPEVFNIPEVNYDGCISFFVKRDGEVCVDIDIDSEDESCIANLAKLVTVITKEECHIETLNMIQEGFMEGGQPELFSLLIINMAEHLPEATRKSIEKTGEQPCIKPSDML